MKQDEQCTNEYNHAYSDHTCPKCGNIFCYACCGNTNVHEGGKYEPDFMTCPKCGQDIYEKLERGISLSSFFKSLSELRETLEETAKDSLIITLTLERWGSGDATSILWAGGYGINLDKYHPTCGDWWIAGEPGKLFLHPEVYRLFKAFAIRIDQPDRKVLFFRDTEKPLTPWLF